MTTSSKTRVRAKPRNTALHEPSAQYLQATQPYQQWRNVFLSASLRERMTFARNGLRASLFDAAAKDWHISQADMLRLIGVSSSTFHRKLEADEGLDATATERLMRITDITHRCEQLFGAKDKALTWLKTPNHALGGDIPLNMLDNEFGAQAVRKVLAAIEYGGAV